MKKSQQILFIVITIIIIAIAILCIDLYWQRSKVPNYSTPQKFACKLQENENDIIWTIYGIPGGNLVQEDKQYLFHNGKLEKIIYTRTYTKKLSAIYAYFNDSMYVANRKINGNVLRGELEIQVLSDQTKEDIASMYENMKSLFTIIE